MSDTNETVCLQEKQDQGSRDKRQWTRFQPEQTESFLLVEEEWVPVEILDESFDGVGVLTAGPVDVSANDSVELFYYGLPVPATVRSVTPQGDRTRLGIQWTRRRRSTADVSRPRCRTESDYIRFAGLPVACRVFDRSGERWRARLPGGREVELAPEDLHTASRFQRLADLQNAGEQVWLLTAVYQLGTYPSPDDALRAVLNLEFALDWD